MNTHNDNTAPRGLRGWWASPPRSGMRRIIAPWEYRHLRAWAGARIAAGNLLALCGFLTLSIGSTVSTTFGLAALFLVAAAAQFSFAYWELTIARSAPPQT
jgi:hypothetical protein